MGSSTIVLVSVDTMWNTLTVSDAVVGVNFTCPADDTGERLLTDDARKFSTSIVNPPGAQGDYRAMVEGEVTRTICYVAIGTFPAGKGCSSVTIVSIPGT